jgi:hypothetical protein
MPEAIWGHQDTLNAESLPHAQSRTVIYQKASFLRCSDFGAQKNCASAIGPSEAASTGRDQIDPRLETAPHDLAWIGPGESGSAAVNGSSRFHGISGKKHSARH